MGWRQLAETLQENRRDQAAKKNEPITICPIDNELLVAHPKTGVLNCPMGNFRAGATSRS